MQRRVVALRYTMLFLIVAVVLRCFFSFLRTYWSNLVGESVVQNLRQQIVDKVSRLSLTRINQISPSQILTRITQDVDSLRRFLFGDFIECIYSVFSFSLIIIVLSKMNLKLTAISLLTLPLFALVYFKLIPELKSCYAELRKKNGLLSSRINEVLNGIKLVRSFSRDTYERNLFQEKQSAVFDVAARTHFLNSWLWITVEFFTSIGVIVILWMGGHDVMTNRMTAGELVAFYTYLGMLFAPIVRTVVINTSYQEAVAAIGRINDIMSSSEIRNIDLPKKDFHLLRGEIVFKDVNFQYSHAEKILHNVNFCINPGEKVGIVGESGSGKTTIVNLALKFLNPSSGTILIDGQNLNDISLHDYREQVSVVLQDDFLFNGTIEENIKYGQDYSNEEDVIRAAQNAQAHKFIMNLKDGYQTEIGERGYKLSNGQRQRIAIARALIKEPKILLLDEATSSLDALTENDIQESIYRYMHGKTVLIVAHRFSTIMECDKIIVLDKGRIVEMGAHNYLLKKKGFYSNLYLEQFKANDRLSVSSI